MYLGGWESLLVLGVGRSDGSPASTCLCICILEMEMTNSRPLHFPVSTRCSCGSVLWELAVHKGSGLVEGLITSTLPLVFQVSLPGLAVGMAGEFCVSSSPGQAGGCSCVLQMML